MNNMLCHDCGYEWEGDEGFCPECHSLDTEVLEDDY